MPRGGSRPGAGRPKKVIDPAAPKPKRVRKPAAAKPAKGFTSDGVKTADAPANWPFGTKPAEPEAEKPAPEPDPSEDPEISGETPLEFLLAVVREKRLKLPIRMQAASIAAPFVHAKPAPGGKKEVKADAAKGVSGGNKFAATAPPLKLVNR